MTSVNVINLPKRSQIKKKKFIVGCSKLFNICSLNMEKNDYTRQVFEFGVVLYAYDTYIFYKMGT